MNDLIIKKLLKDRNITYEKLAKLSGISRNTINMLLNGRAPMTDQYLRTILEAIQITPEEFQNLEYNEEVLSFAGRRTKYKTDTRSLDQHIRVLEEKIKEQDREIKLLVAKNEILERWIKYVEETTGTYKKLTKNGQ